MNTTCHQLIRALDDHPKDWGLMFVLSDELRDCGEELLAKTYKWAALRQRWPFLRSARAKELTSDMDGMSRPKVYDWDKESRNTSTVARYPELLEALLPDDVYNAIRLLSNRYYSIYVGDAFVLLSRGLDLYYNSGTGVCWEWEEL